MESKENIYDLVVVGGGPAGLSAAIYMARAKYRVLVVEKASIGGQITITSEIVNYPGVEKTSGKELTETMRRQAEAFGAEFMMGEVLDLELEQEIKRIHTTKGCVEALGVLLATGANPRKLGFKGEHEFQGRGVAYCATCDGEFFTGKDVFVIGGGFAAVEEAIFLTKYAKKVTVVVRKNAFSCARTISDQLKSYEKIHVLFETELLEVGGDQLISYAKFKDNRTNRQWTYEPGKDEAFGIFVFAGYVPNTQWLPTSLEKEEQGYLITDRNQKTNLEGVYAAGDVCMKELRQVVTAVSDGAVAATSLEKAVSKLHSKLKIPELAQPDRPRTVPADIREQSVSDGEFLNHEIRKQMEGILAKFQHAVLMRAWLDSSPLSGEIEGFLRELEGMTDKLRWEKANSEGPEEKILPSIELCYEDGSSSGIQFHGVPGGHEFNSFVIALYNVAGPGQDMDPDLEKKLKTLTCKQNLKILVSLSCTMCPETVMAAQKAAAVSQMVEAEMFDLTHFPQLKEKYNVMSVPCLVLNDENVFFGKKGLRQVIDLLTENKK